MFDVYQSTSQSTPLILKHTVLGEAQQEKDKKNMRDRSPDIFDTEEEGERNKEYEEEEEEEEDPTGGR